MADAKTRPIVPLAMEDAVEHRRLIAMRTNSAFPKDGTEGMQDVLLLKSYTVAGVPAAGLWTGGIIYVSNETGGATLAFSDGTNWRRAQDRTIISA